jgi:hypothetical protein
MTKTFDHISRSTITNSGDLIQLEIQYTDGTKLDLAIPVQSIGKLVMILRAVGAEAIAAGPPEAYEALRLALADPIRLERIAGGVTGPPENRQPVLHLTLENGVPLDLIVARKDLETVVAAVRAALEHMSAPSSGGLH